MIAGQRQPPTERRLGWRIALGLLQLLVGLAGLVLLMKTGINVWTLTTLIVMCLLTPVRTWVKHYRAPPEE